MFADDDDRSSHDGRDSVGTYPNKKKPATGKKAVAKGQGPGLANTMDGGAAEAGGGNFSVGADSRYQDESAPSQALQEQQTQADPTMAGHQQNMSEYPKELEDENGVPIENRAPRKTIYERVGLPPKSHVPGLGGKRKDDDLPSLGGTSTKTQTSSYPSDSRSASKDKRKSDNTQNKSYNTNNNNNRSNNYNANGGGGGNGCCGQQPCCHPCQPCGTFFNPCQQQIYQSPCQIGVIPMRSAAFEAPRIPLPKLCDHLLPPCCDEDEDEDGVAFQFKPQTNCRTEVTFTIEPKPQPPWLTMLNCGFKPMVNCSAPPCYLSPSGNPGMNFVPGTQSVVNRTFGSQVNYAGMANFPTLDQIRNSLPGSKVHGMGMGHHHGHGQHGHPARKKEEHSNSGSESNSNSDDESLPQGKNKDNKKRKSGGRGSSNPLPRLTFDEGHHKHHHLIHPQHHHHRQSGTVPHMHPLRASRAARPSMMYPHHHHQQQHHGRKPESEDSFQQKFKGGGEADSDYSRSDDWHY